MLLVSRIIRKYKYLLNKSYLYLETKKAATQLKNLDATRPKIFLMCCPIHTNLGDQAQRLCIERWIKETYPQHQLIASCARTVPSGYYENVSKILNEKDLIFIHSGYLFMNDLSDVPAILKIVELYKRNKIIFFPQTVNFSCDEIKQEFVNSFAQNKNILLLCRDYISYENAKTLFPNNECLAFPDIVTSLIGSYHSSQKRSGVCFCLRNDKEKYYSDSDLEKLITKLKTYNCCRIDTTLKLSFCKMNVLRKKYIYDMVDFLSSKKVVVTDRYHGTIFSIIANTPVVVLNSTDHKLSSGVKWFPKQIFDKSIYFADDLDEAYDIVTKILTANVELNNPSYFLEKYFSKLSDIVKDAN